MGSGSCGRSKAVSGTCSASEILENVLHLVPQFVHFGEMYAAALVWQRAQNTLRPEFLAPWSGRV